MTLLITGATGTVSSELLRALPATAGVRVLVRDLERAPKGVEVAVGDLELPETLTDAFAGVETLWLLTAMGPTAPHAASNALWAARQAGVRHVVRLSAIGAGHDAPTRNGRLHALSEIELAASGLGWTVIRPAFFMQNLFGSVNGGTLYGPTGEGKFGLIDVRDVAAFAARVLADPGSHQGRTYTLTGPESISLREAAERIGVGYQPVRPEDALQAMLQAGLPEWDAAVNVEYARAYAAGWADYTTGDFAEVMGHPARTFEKFAADHAEQLGS